MAQSATPATQNPTSRHNRGTASQLRKRVHVTDEEDFRVTDEGLSLLYTKNIAYHLYSDLFIFIVYSRPGTQKEREEHAPHLRELLQLPSIHPHDGCSVSNWLKPKRGYLNDQAFDGKLGTTWNYILGVLFFHIETAAGTLHKSLARVQCIDGNEANLETLILLLKQNHAQKVFWTATPQCSRVNPHGRYG